MANSVASRRLLRAAAACGVGMVALAGVVVPASVAVATPVHAATQTRELTVASTGLHPGARHVTFDEAFPAFTYTGNSFNNANAYGPTSSDQPNYTSSIKSDTAGENLFGRNVHYEPTGPNSTLGTNKQGDQLYPGPGNNAFVDRPPVCTQTTPTLVPADCVPGIVRGGAGSPLAAGTDKVTGTTGSNVIADNAILADDTGREVTGTNIPANSFVGPPWLRRAARPAAVRQ